MSLALEDDRRWKRLNGRLSPCSCCGTQFSGVFDIGFDHPDPWPHGHRGATGKTTLEVGDDRLSADYCTLQEHRFIRATLPLPIIGSDTTFCFGPWVMVSDADFITYLQAEGGVGEFVSCEGLVINTLPGIAMDRVLPCDMRPSSDAQARPEVRVHPGPPLAQWQDDGITFNHLLDIYAAAGQDIRPHLGDA
ncbi:MAG: DUF2199 domain-containing protein [Pseudomonadota bacterium]